MLTRPETLVSVTAVKVLKHEVLAGKLKAAEQSSEVNEMQSRTNVLVIVKTKLDKVGDSTSVRSTGGNLV